MGGRRLEIAKFWGFWPSDYQLVVDDYGRIWWRDLGVVVVEGGLLDEVLADNPADVVGVVVQQTRHIGA